MDKHFSKCGGLIDNSVLFWSNDFTPDSYSQDIDWRKIAG